MPSQGLRANIIETIRRMRAERLVMGTAGNVSAREPGSGAFWITPSGVEYDQLTADQLVCVDLEGHVVSGRLKPSSDTGNHVAIYRRRKDVDGIVHTHSTYATVFAVLHRDIPPLLVEAAGYLGGAVPVSDYVPPAQPESGELAAQSLGHSRAVLLPNHGVITVGESVANACMAAVLVEHGARVAYLASLLGKPESIAADEIERMNRFMHEEYGQRGR